MADRSKMPAAIFENQHNLNLKKATKYLTGISLNWSHLTARIRDSIAICVIFGQIASIPYLWREKFRSPVKPVFLRYAQIFSL